MNGGRLVPDASFVIYQPYFSTLNMNAKTIVVGFLIGAALIGGAFFLTNKTATQIAQQPLSAEGVAKVNELLTRDTDRDGLMDWEEELWQTDSTKSDTDSDGAPDGEEIRLKRNPIVPGPNDPLDEEAIREKVNEPLPLEEQTRTAEFSRSFFNNYLNARREFGGKLPPNALEFLISDSLTDLPNEPERSSFTEQDLTVSLGGAEDLRRYGNELAEAIATSSPADLEDAGEIIARAIAKESEEELVLLAPHLAAYERFIASLLALPVPKEALRTHLELVNTVEGARRGLAGIKALFSDPLSAFPSLILFQESGKKLQTAFRAVQAVFIREKIRFSPEESGYLIEQIEV